MTPAVAATDRKLVSVTWPLLLIMSLMLLLSLASISLLTSLRAYVNGEGHWSKAERQAIAELRNYSASGRESDYRLFAEELSVPLGDRAARLTLQSSSPDIDAATRGLLAGRNHPADIPGMIRLFRLFSTNPLMRDAIRLWTLGDGLILQLGHTGQQLHAEVQSGHANPRRIAALLDAAEQIHRLVAPAEDGFSVALGDASRNVANLLLVFLVLCSAALVAAGMAISRANLRRGEKMELALRAAADLAYLEQERAHVTLGSISDAVISTGCDQRVTYMNEAAENLTGWTWADAENRLLSEVLSFVEEAGVLSVSKEFARIMAGEQVSGGATGILLRRRDGSEIPVHERAAPVRGRNGEAIGIVMVLRDIAQERAFSSRLKYQATHDALTGLANRREFEVQLSAAIDDQRKFGNDYALLYLDLDQFKVINDTCGHAAGDELIRQVSWTVQDQLRDGDLLARLGGDEFGALLPHCASSEAVKKAELLRRQIADLRFRWDDKLFVVNASIGVLSLGEALPTVSDALSAADQACYLAKDSGRNRVQLYRPDDQQVQNRHGEMRWVERINAALDEDSFVLVAQEIMPIGVRASVFEPERRFELLLRMVEPDGGCIAPMAFIPAAERYGLMPRIDRWVIARACRELASLRCAGRVLPTCMINLSGTSVSDPSLADYIGACLTENALSGRYIGFELTETAAIGNLASASHLMSRLRALGCPIALDDFGSGMSSFSYLKALPIDFLKIDGTFVRDVSTDPVDFAVVEAIQRIGSVMGIKTVAECVEDEAAMIALAQIGVDFVQGFHVRRPIALAQIQEAAPAGASRSDYIEVAVGGRS